MIDTLIVKLLPVLVRMMQKDKRGNVRVTNGVDHKLIERTNCNYF